MMINVRAEKALREYKADIRKEIEMANKKSQFVFTFHVWREKDGDTEHSLNVSLFGKSEAEATDKLSKVVDLSVYKSILKEVSESNPSQ